MDNTMRDKIAALMWKTQSIDAGAPQSVANGRTLVAFLDAGNEVRRYWIKQADAIIAALPSMVKPLVWDGIEDDCFVSCDLLGKSYQLVVCDTLERSCDYNWAATVIIDGKEMSVRTPAQASFAEAKAAANAHNVAQHMAAFGVNDMGCTN